MSFRPCYNLFFIALFLVLAGCKTSKNVLFSDDKQFVKQDESIAFTQPRHSIVAFRPKSDNPDFSESDLDRFKKEMNKLYTFFRGVTTNCPILTSVDDSGYMRYVNREGTFYFHAPSEKRKEQVGIVISDGTRKPKVIWGLTNYLADVKQYFGVKTYQDFLKKLPDEPREKPETASPDQMKPLPDSSQQSNVGRTFIKRFWANNQEIFHNRDKKGVKRITIQNECATGSTNTTEIWYDKKGFPQKQESTGCSPSATSSIEYIKSSRGLIIREKQTIESSPDNIVISYLYQYYPDKVIKYQIMENKQDTVAVYRLDDKKRVSWWGIPGEEEGQYTFEQEYNYDGRGSLVRTKRTTTGTTSNNFFRYDKQGRQIRSNYMVGEESDMLTKTTYHSPTSSSTVVYKQGVKQPEKTVTRYNKHGDPIHIDFYNGGSVSYKYEYYEK